MRPRLQEKILHVIKLVYRELSSLKQTPIKIMSGYLHLTKDKKSGNSLAIEPFWLTNHRINNKFI